jgi:lysosomal acid lipase/cholesteryl ester hydrolase
MYLVFGRRAILSSTPLWASLLYPPLFSYLIDTSLVWLFNWKLKNITGEQKLAAYSHMYRYSLI